MNDNDKREYFTYMASTSFVDNEYIYTPVRYQEPTPMPYDCLYCGSTMDYDAVLKAGHCLRCGAPMYKWHVDDIARGVVSESHDETVPLPRKKRWWEFWR